MRLPWVRPRLTAGRLLAFAVGGFCQVEGHVGSEGGYVEFAACLYAMYRSGLGGTLRFDDFVQQQLAVDLMAEFMAADQEGRRGILVDVLNLLIADDFERDEEPG